MLSQLRRYLGRIGQVPPVELEEAPAAAPFGLNAAGEPLAGLPDEALAEARRARVRAHLQSLWGEDPDAYDIFAGRSEDSDSERDN